MANKVQGANAESNLNFAFFTKPQTSQPPALSIRYLPLDFFQIFTLPFQCLNR
jgi:hypothetical protein